MKRASGEPASRAAAALIGVTASGELVTAGASATPSAMSFADSEAPTSPVNPAVLMTVPQARDALLAFSPDLQPLVTAIARAFWDDGYMVGIARGSRVGPLDRSPPGENTLAPLGKRGKR